MKGDPVIEGQVAESISTETINLLDSDNSNLLSVKWNEDDSLDRTLNLMLSGANRDLTLSGNVALNQSLLTTSSPTFNNLTLTNPTFAMFGLSAPVDSSIPQWDVVNSVWTWSTGIADLSGFTTDDLDEGTNNKYFPGFTSLSTDYNFTDNSSNWNTAYGWGDHADANYLSAASTGITANSWTINSTQANVTSTLTFGRTTGGDATLSWDGVSQKFNNQIEVTGSNNFYNIVAKGPSPDSTGALCGIAFSALNLSNRIKAAIGTVWEGAGWGLQDLVFAVRSIGDNTNVTLADEKMRIAYDGTVTTTNNLYVGGNVSAESFTARSGQITFPATQAPNTVFAGPATGVVNGYPTFRALVASDIPALNYIDTETDPVFTAWDKSTGISITESQISDFGTYLTSLTGLTTDNLTEGTTNKYFPGFTSLLTDYSFTDNSSNWDTAYGWGDHASGGYIKADGTVNFTNKVSYNNDKTFTSDTELVSKKYVDDSITGVGGYTDEMAQDAVGAMADTNSLTYVDATPSLSVKLQMSLTSDASGIKLSGDAATPGNNKVYGTNASGTKGWYDAGAGSITYPAAGIALSTGSAWGSSITDNSANWNTAYSWGNHASANYLSAASTGITANSWTINSTQANVTSTLTFGRTTGGDATISWDGTSLTSSSPARVPSLGVGVKPAPIIQLYNRNDNLILDGTSNRYGFYNVFTRTGGDNDGSSIYFCLRNVYTYNQSGGYQGTTYGISNECSINAGTVGTASDNKDFFLLYNYGGVGDNGVVKGTFYGIQNDIRATTGSTIGSSVVSYYSRITNRSNASGYHIYLNDVAGVDYAIYHQGTAPSYFGGNVSAESFTARSGQITFPATQVPSANANTLDDYREGTFVPTVYCSGGGGYTLDPSYDTLSYVKIGSLITVTGHLIITDKDSVSGWVRITIPFACASLGGATYSSGVVRLTGLASGNGIGAASITGGSRYIGLYKPDGIELTKAEAGYSFSVNISLTFRAAN